MDPRTILSVRGLRASYGQAEVLHDVDFDVAENGITTILGANGAGKTTTMRAICQVMVKTSGEIRLDGSRIDHCATESIVRKGVAVVPDGRGTFAHLTVDENLKVGAYTRSDRGGIDEDRERMFTWFPKLKSRLKQQAGTLSGGEQQMLAIARALMSRPRLLLLDEPSFGLAPMTVRELFEILKQINRHDRVAMLLVEQNAALALDLADHAYLLETGRVVMAGRSRDIRDNDEVRRSYLGY